MLRTLKSEYYCGVRRASLWVLAGILAVVVAFNILTLYSAHRSDMSDYVDVLRSADKIAAQEPDEVRGMHGQAQYKIAKRVVEMSDVELQNCFDYALMYDVACGVAQSGFAPFVAILVPLCCLGGDLSDRRMGDYISAGRSRLVTYLTKMIFVLTASTVLSFALSLLGVATYFKAWLGHFRPAAFFPYFFKAFTAMLPYILGYACLSAAVVLVVRNPAVAIPVALLVLIVLPRVFTANLPASLSVDPAYSYHPEWWYVRGFIPSSADGTSWLPVWIQSGDKPPFPGGDFLPYMLSFHGAMAAVGLTSGWLAFRRANLG